MAFKKFFRLVCVVTLAISLLGTAAAQAQTGSSTTQTRGGPRRQLATILFAGLGGAVLGLSTLSFYGRPQDKLANIALGFAGGVIIGTTFVTYRAATNPAEFYGAMPGEQPLIEREIELSKQRAPSFDSAPQLAFNFEF